jgi:hypothetical protein
MSVQKSLKSLRASAIDARGKICALIEGIDPIYGASHLVNGITVFSTGWMNGNPFNAGSALSFQSQSTVAS